MKKFYLAILNFFVISLTIFAQTPNWEWVKQGGSTGNDQGVLCAGDIYNNVYVTGYFQGSATFGSTILTSNGGNDGFIAKYDSSGALLWVKQIGGSGEDGGYGITVDSAGADFYVTGWYTGTVLFDATSSPSHGNQEVFIAKYNSSGVLQWVKHGGSASAPGQGLGVAVDKSQQYVYATGYIGISSSFDTTALSNPYVDVFLAKYNASTGALVWAKHAGGPSDDYGVEIATDHLGHVYLAGYCKSTATFDTIPITNSGASHSNFLAKYDSNGNVIWVKATTGYGEWNKCLAIDSSEANIYVYGSFRNTTSYGSNTFTSYGGDDIGLASYDSSGTLTWVKRFGGPGEDAAGEIALDKWSNIYLTGTFSNTASFIDSSITSAGGKDAFVAKFDPVGTLLWIKGFGGTGDDEGQGMSINNDGSIINLSGDFTGPATFGSFLQNGYGGKDVYLSKLRNEVTGVFEVLSEGLVTIYPNPSNGHLIFSFQNAFQKGAIEIFNSLGQEIYSEKISTSISKKEINLNAAAGIYFVKVENVNQSYAQKLVIE
jgi:hypothetical protein